MYSARAYRTNWSTQWNRAAAGTSVVVKTRNKRLAVEVHFFHDYISYYGVGKRAATVPTRISRAARTTFPKDLNAQKLRCYTARLLLRSRFDVGPIRSRSSSAALPGRPGPFTTGLVRSAPVVLDAASGRRRCIYIFGRVTRACTAWCPMPKRRRPRANRDKKKKKKNPYK